MYIVLSRNIHIGALKKLDALVAAPLAHPEGHPFYHAWLNFQICVVAAWKLM